MMIGYRLAREYNSLETKMRRNSAVMDNQEIGLEQVVKRIKKKKKRKNNRQVQWQKWFVGLEL